MKHVFSVYPRARKPEYLVHRSPVHRSLRKVVHCFKGINSKITTLACTVYGEARVRLVTLPLKILVKKEPIISQATL